MVRRGTGLSIHVLASMKVGMTSVTANQTGSVMSKVLKTFHN